MSEYKIYIICVAKLMLVPLTCLLGLKLLTTDLSLLEKTLTLSFAMPCGAVAAIFTKEYHSVPDFATKTVLLSTVFSIITIPIFAIFLELI